MFESTCLVLVNYTLNVRLFRVFGIKIIVQKIYRQNIALTNIFTKIFPKKNTSHVCEFMLKSHLEMRILNIIVVITSK